MTDWKAEVYLFLIKLKSSVLRRKIVDKYIAPFSLLGSFPSLFIGIVDSLPFIINRLSRFGNHSQKEEI